MIPEVQDIIDVAIRMFMTCLVMAVPPLGTALIVGVTVSLMQTVTSIQEATLTFVPKLLAVIVVVAVSMPWIIEFMCEYYEDIMQMFSSYY